MDLESLKTPNSEGRQPVQAKYTLSTEARERLRAASVYTGQDMSTILEMLIREHLPMDLEPAITTSKQETGDFNID